MKIDENMIKQILEVKRQERKLLGECIGRAEPVMIPMLTDLINESSNAEMGLIALLDCARNQEKDAA